MMYLAAEEAQSPLLPVWPEIVIGLICFGIVFFVFSKKLLPVINKTLEERREAIEGGIEKAEAAQTEAQSVLEQYKAQLAEARHEAARLRQEAQEQGAVIIQEMKAEGQRQREEIIAAGHTQIEADRKAAASALRQDVGKLATDLAGKLVGESLQDHARQSGTVDRFLDELRGEGRGCPMNGASREALAAARERLDALTDNTSVDAAALAEDLASVTALSTARFPCAGFSRTRPRAARARPSWSRACSAIQVSGEAVDLVSGLVRSRWSQSRDLVDSVEELANTADLTAAQRTGALDDVEDELFRFGRIVGSDTELRSALTSRTATTAAKSELLRSLLGGKAQRPPSGSSSAW
ncbi:ATP synthase subunit b [Streptomyces microflavus]